MTWELNVASLMCWICSYLTEMHIQTTKWQTSVAKCLSLIIRCLVEMGDFESWFISIAPNLEW